MVFLFTKCRLASTDQERTDRSTRFALEDLFGAEDATEFFWIVRINLPSDAGVLELDRYIVCLARDRRTRCVA